MITTSDLRKIEIYDEAELAEISRRMGTNTPLTEKDVIAVFNILERTYEGVFALSWDLMTKQCYIHYHGVKFHTIQLK